MVTLVFCGSAKAHAAEPSMDDILSALSCETGFVADTINYTMPYTCVQNPLFSQMSSAFKTGGTSLFVTMRLKMHQEEIYPGNCSRGGRANYWDQKIKFGFCNNYKLQSANVMSIIRNAMAGQAPTMPAKSEYLVDGGDHAPDGMPHFLADVSILTATNFWWIYKTQKRQDKLCVFMLSLFGEWVTLGCKYMAEPYPLSMYATESANATSGNDISKCSSISDCTAEAKKATKTLTPLMSPIISCVREMILRLVISPEVCNPSTGKIASARMSTDALLSSARDNTSMIYKFQTNLQSAVTFLLIIYVIMFGFKVATGATEIKNKDFIYFVFKVLFVAYFSIGINMQAGARQMRFDGMTGIIFPFLLTGVTEVASWMMGAASINGLCAFPADAYPAGSDINMPLWDQIDCRLAYYIGYDGLVQKLMTDTSNDPVQHQVPPYVFLLVPALITGNSNLIMLALTYPIMIISFVAYSLCLFVSAMILILILGAMAPIFIPCVLFDFTKEYFSKWWKILFGLMLQPAIALTFMGLMFAVYDKAFYGTCIYNSVKVKYTNPVGTEPRTSIYYSFFITLDTDQYAAAAGSRASADDVQQLMNGCTSSLGFFFNNPLQSIFGGVTNPGLSTSSQLLGQVNTNPTTGAGASAIDLSKLSNTSQAGATGGAYGDGISINPTDRNSAKDLLAFEPSDAKGVFNSINKPQFQWHNGLLTQSPKMFWEELMQILKNMIVCFIMLTVIKHLMESITSFISALSGTEIKAGGTFDPGKIQAGLTKIAGAGASKAAAAVAAIKESAQEAKSSSGVGKDAAKDRSGGDQNRQGAGGGGDQNRQDAGGGDKSKDGNIEDKLKGVVTPKSYTGAMSQQPKKRGWW